MKSGEKHGSHSRTGKEAREQGITRARDTRDVLTAVLLIASLIIIIIVLITSIF